MIIAVTFIFLLVFGRVFYIQIVWGNHLQSKAIDQWTRELPVRAERGRILDRNGVVLAFSGDGYSVFIRNRSVDNPQEVANTLSEILGVDQNSLLEKMKKAGSSEITVKRQVDKKTVDKISKTNLNGVYFAKDSKRVYPYNEFLCQILGYTSIDGRGQSGIEKRYDEYLAGYDGEILYEADLVGKNLDGSSARYIAATDGLDVKLTVDYEIQQICEAVTTEAMATFSPKSVSILVVDPSCGDILAISQKPSFDLNFVPRENIAELNKLSRCSVIVDSYEPGSTFKVLTAAANVEEYYLGNQNAFSENYVFNSNRYRIVDGRKVKCWSTHAGGKHSNENLAMALNNSCNPCFVDIALSLGKEKMYDYIDKMGYGKVTGIDYDGEAIGMLVPESAVTKGDLARISFGQTIAVTPLQLAMATSSIVNGGNYYCPRLVCEIADRQGNIAQIIEPVMRNKTVSQKTSQIIAGYLEDVVKNGGGKQAYIEGFRVGGKTGTAQKFENGNIVMGKNIMSFVGFFPANNPKYLALAVVDEPNGGVYGSTVAAPLIKEVFEGIIQCKNLSPQKEVNDEI